jgi:DNA-binding SARP family transcriptional activator
LEFHVLGPMEVVDDGRGVQVVAGKERALLAQLALLANRVVSRDRLIQVAWGDDPPPTATATLNTYISHLRNALEPSRTRRTEGDVLLTRPPGYVLAVDDAMVDALRFERLVAKGRRALASGDPAGAGAALDESLRLWRGPALVDFATDLWARPEAARLEELHVAAKEDRVEADLLLGRSHELVSRLQRLVAEHPLRERLWAQLMIALYRSGRQGEALRTFGRLRGLLADEMGIDPSPSLQRLEQDILNQRPSLEPRSARPSDPASTTVRPPPSHHAQQLCERRARGMEEAPARSGTIADRLRSNRRRAFVGRAGEVELFRSTVEALELPFAVLFVHGPGGIGKTSLLSALSEVAQEAGAIAARVDARTIEPSPPAFAAALASALGLPEGTDPLDTLSAGRRRYVLLLDTYEAAAPLDGWLRGRFLPELPAGVLVVIAGRKPPSRAWVADPGWRELLRVVTLRNLRPEDARAYLGVEGIPKSLHDSVLGLTHGHPLALSLFVDVLSQSASSEDAGHLFELADTPDVVRLLLERFIDGVPNARQRRALEVCAHSRFTTEALVRHVWTARTPVSSFPGCGRCHSSRRSRWACFPMTLRATLWTPICAGETPLAIASCTDVCAPTPCSAQKDPRAWNSSVPARTCSSCIEPTP